MTDVNGGYRVDKIRAWAFFHEVRKNLQSYSFLHSIEVARLLRLIQKPEDRNGIHVVELARPHHALYFLNVFAGLSCKLPL